MTRHKTRSTLALALLSFCGLNAVAAVLPEDRADLLYHRYDGGGVTIDGPSVLVRKKFGEKLGVSANYYMDMVSSASIDVQLISGASRYEEEREQMSLSLDYLRGKSTYSLGVINSEESDYEANTSFFSISQDMFGDLTTVTLSFKRGWNDIFRNTQVAGVSQRDPTFAAQSDARGYGLGVSQVLTRNAVLNINYEVITDEGFLNSPYRQIRFLDSGSGRGFSLDDEIYPRTHTSNAVSGRLKYFMPWRAAIDGQYRFFTDTWGIQAHTVKLGYTHPMKQRWIFDGSVRFYKQDAADFYSDLFPRANFQNFMARDKELSTFQSYTIGFGATYEFNVARLPWMQKSSLNLRYDHLFIDYDDFRDATVTGLAPGTEPLYELNADVVQLFLSVWF
jgi:hypothetical protein